MYPATASLRFVRSGAQQPPASTRRLTTHERGRLLGLALATSLASWLALIWQVLWLAKAGRLNSSAVKISLKAVMASAVMASGLYLALPWLYVVLTSDFTIMVSSILLGFIIYLISGHALGLTKAFLVSVKEQRA